MLHDAAEKVIRDILKLMAGQPAGALLPTQAVLVARLDCAPSTVVKAVRRMRERKLIVKTGDRDFLAEGGETPLLQGMEAAYCQAGEVLAARRGMEGVAVEQVAERIGQGALYLKTRIERLIECVEESKATRNLARHEAIDWDVHSGLVELSGNVAIQRQWRLMERQYLASIKNNVRRLCSDAQYRADNCQYHMSVLTFTLHGQPDLARQALEAHLRHATRRLGHSALGEPLR